MLKIIYTERGRMKKYFSHILLLILTMSYSSAQIIVSQGFEDNNGEINLWTYDADPQAYNGASSGDEWGSIESLSLISPYAGEKFWGVLDVDNNFASGVHSIDFEQIDISSYADVRVSFYYYSHEFDTPDYLKYEFYYDGQSQGAIDLSKNTGEWVKVEELVPSGVQTIALTLLVKQNGATDYAGFDEIIVSSGDPINYSNNVVINGSTSIIGSATIDDSAVIGVDLSVPKIVVNQINTSDGALSVLSSIEAEGFIGSGSGLTDLPFLAPNMLEDERDALETRIVGQIILCTDCKSEGEMQYWNGLSWVNMIGEPASTGRDTTPPVITLIGESVIEIQMGSTFEDPGATAHDDKDGDISADIIVTGTVETVAEGTYTLTYNVSDSSGNSAETVIRTIIVLPANSNSSSSTATSDGKFIYAMGPDAYEMDNESGYYSFDPASKTFSQTDLDPYVQEPYRKWTKPAVSGNGKIFEFSSQTEIRNATENIITTLPGGYKAYTYYDYVNGFDSNVSSAIFLVRTDTMSEHGVHIAYFDDQNNVQILDPGFEFKGGMENMSHQYEEGYFFITKYGVNNPSEYYVINFNEQTPETVKINFPYNSDSSSKPFSKTYAGDGKFYLSYQKNDSDNYSKTILMLDAATGDTTEVFTTSSAAAFLTMASNGKLYYHNPYGNNQDANIHVYDPSNDSVTLIAPPAGSNYPMLFAPYGKTLELNGKLFLKYYINTHTPANVQQRLYEIDISDNTVQEVNPNGALDNYAYRDFYGPYSDDRNYNQPFNPAFVYNGKLYMIFRGNNDSSKHYIMIYDGVSAELIDPEQAGGLKSFVEMMFI